ncbi:MAG: TIGR02147 family protein [Fibrobacterales bacterium]
MISLFDYNDYREYLRDFYSDKKSKNGYISYRMMGGSLDVAGPYLIKLFKLQGHLKDEAASKIVALCKLKGKEADYMEALFHFSKAKKEVDIERWYEAMQMIRGVDALTLKTGQYEFYSKWYYSAVWALLRIKGMGSLKKIGGIFTPKISDTEVKESLSLLQTLNLITDTDGEWETTAQHLVAGDLKKGVIKKYHASMIELGKESVQRFSGEERTVRGITLAIDDECYRDIQEILDDTFKKIRARVNDVEDANRVVQANIQLFPLTQDITNHD